jgi:hypothetical protein
VGIAQAELIHPQSKRATNQTRFIGTSESIVFLARQACLAGQLNTCNPQAKYKQTRSLFLLLNLQIPGPAALPKIRDFWKLFGTLGRKAGFGS